MPAVELLPRKMRGRALIPPSHVSDSIGPNLAMAFIRACPMNPRISLSYRCNRIRSSPNQYSFTGSFARYAIANA